MKRKGRTGVPKGRRVQRHREKNTSTWIGDPHPNLDVINPRQGPIQPFRSKDYPRNAAPFVDPSFLPPSIPLLLFSSSSSPDLVPGSLRRDAENAPFSGHEGAQEGGEGVRAIRRKHARLLYANWVTSQLRGGRGVGEKNSERLREWEGWAYIDRDCELDFCQVADEGGSKQAWRRGGFVKEKDSFLFDLSFSLSLFLVLFPFFPMFFSRFIIAVWFVRVVVAL